jgi:2,3-bisphosphoglycerate-independent phosphoglycerate mutase
MMTGNGETTTLSASEYIKSEYAKDIYDEFITPALLSQSGKVESDDCLFFLNFRPDRAKQISLAFCDPKFSHFKNEIRPHYYLCMSPYIDEEFPEVPVLFSRENIKGTLCEYISDLGLKQLKIAETEKYAHVTYFFNGGAEKPFAGEERILVNSPKEVATYDLKPEMSAPEVLEKLTEKLRDNSFSFYVVNFANPDMVGHTGNYKAAVKAMEHIDKCLASLEKTCLKENISMLVTADHGNCDQMTYPDGSAHTSHSGANVPLILVSNSPKVDNPKEGQFALKDVAPTILHLLGIEKNDLITGETVFK